ncbi:immunoglobulin-like domain-containing protein [Listeria fleischmannii]|uniref:Putative peptidoglycan linked protein n=1 Tax=Listeria fleischmannii FSL S10-1203 TaxID=1265822 RepID=W7DCZ8_9LIST|nr:immunoglobulin-like domain-containing protein [Listeria fleischmannii]EUJ47030.1 putative peptidoglycan linked protein [Listeria fleischmannii FSL S10-1203]
MPAANNTFSVKIPAELTYTPDSLSSGNTMISNEQYNAATRTLTFTTDAIKKDATVAIQIPLTGAQITTAATPDTTVTYNDENFNEDHYTADGTDQAITVTSNEVPVLTGEKETTLQPNALFDPMSTMTAEDKEDGNLTGAIKVLENPVDTSQSGTYEVKYEVTDSDGNLATFTRMVIVTEAPRIIGAESKTITEGTLFDSREGITAIDKEDGDLTASIQVDGDVDEGVPGQYPITYTVTDSDGNQTKTSIIITVKAKPTEGTLTADAYQVGGSDAYIHGTTTGDVSYVRLSVNGQFVSQRLVDEDGTYKYYTRPAILSVNDEAIMVRV